MALPYLEAFRQMKSGKITWNEYIHHLLARCTGVEHDDDDAYQMAPWQLYSRDPFGYSVYNWSNSIENVKDATPFEDVFIACHAGSLDDVKEKLARLNDRNAKGIRQPLSFLALQERRADVLKYCTDPDGFPNEPWYEAEANRVDKSKNPETFRVLEQSHFRHLGTGVEPLYESDHEEEDEDEEDDDNDDDDSDDLIARAAAFDVGGRFPVEW